MHVAVTGCLLGVLQFASWDCMDIKEVVMSIWIVWTEEWPGLTQGFRSPDITIAARETFA